MTERASLTSDSTESTEADFADDTAGGAVVLRPDSFLAVDVV
jgi:hypothetical protein